MSRFAIFYHVLVLLFKQHFEEVCSLKLGCFVTTVDTMVYYSALVMLSRLYVGR